MSPTPSFRDNQGYLCRKGSSWVPTSTRRHFTELSIHWVSVIHSQGLLHTLQQAGLNLADLSISRFPSVGCLGLFRVALRLERGNKAGKYHLLFLSVKGRKVSSHLSNPSSNKKIDKRT